MKTTKLTWIIAGYNLVSDAGFDALKVEHIAKEIGKNKSSFYHYFGDLENFELELVAYHFELSKAFSINVQACESIIPDLVHVLIEHKTDIFFHKQLRLKIETADFKKYQESVFKLFEQSMLENWQHFTQLDNAFLATKFLNLISENFLLQITKKNYHFEWLKQYIIDQTQLLREIKNYLDSSKN